MCCLCWMPTAALGLLIYGLVRLVVVICKRLAKVWRQMIRDRILPAVFEVWHWIVAFATGEFMLDYFRWRNGSAVIVARSIWGTVLIVGLRLVIINLVVLDNKEWFTIDKELARVQLGQSGKWIAAAFAGLYTAFYAKFSSQWSYLAGVYNEIKRAESVEKRDEEKIAEWKAGLIVDAMALHLENNSVFEPLIDVWKRDPRVAGKLQLGGIPVENVSYASFDIPG